jgi:tRNA (cytidine32/uridine32-2'-O)-methyltransferase
MGDRSILPLPFSTYDLHVVLVGIQHPGNLGAVCRSLLNHGFDSLRLVQPQCHPDDIEARNRAKHAGRILDSCKLYDSFEEAVSDCSLVVGTSGKREIGDKTQKRHFMYPWEFSERISRIDQSVALVFGRTEYRRSTSM